MRFRATLVLGGRTATGMTVPAEVVESFGQGRKPQVLVTINGYTYRSTVAVRDGQFMVPVSAEVRAGAGVEAGDEIDVDLEPDTAPRTVVVPADLAAALAGDPTAKARFEALSYSGQRQHVLALDGAKTDATRQRRLEKILAALVSPSDG
ncbi:YdeI/OmpD-associated family protein [Dactylosporangium sp. NPDC006015]|uniref:YdeI/OmpD-associated family protein n=1 Tax=Dactylosporangium sp. NPDC006015 TaxID=3154576 RepID=UPI0033A1CCA9